MTREPMRIAQLCADRGIAPGGTKGASMHLRGIAAGLVELGHDVTTFAARSAQGDHPVLCRPLDEFDAGRCDLVYERYSLGSMVGLTAARRAGRPFVLEVNAPLVDEATTHRPDTVAPGHRAVEAELLAAADLVVVVSSQLAAWAATMRSGPILAIPNGFEPEWFGGVRPEPTHDLVFIGHPKPWHGAERIPQFLADLASRGIEATALLVGGGAGADLVSEHARSLGVEASIEVTGAMAPPEAARRIAGARIGLAPYRQLDPFYFCPLKVIDYLAAGLPIVASNIGDVPGLVGDAGLTVEPDDDDAFVNAIADLLGDDQRRRALGEAGRRRALASHTWTHVAAATIDAVSANMVVPSCA